MLENKLNPIKHLRNSRGLSLVELIVAAGIMGVLVFAIMSMKTMVFKMSQGVLQRSSNARIIFSIQEELVKEMDSLPFRSDAAFITGPTFDQALYEASFDDTNAQKICYDKEGMQIPFTTDPVCEFNVSYYRVQEVDRNYTGTLSQIPLSRLVMRLNFIDSNTKTARSLYLSRLKAHVIKY
jgi:hypothetical protein